MGLDFRPKDDYVRFVDTVTVKLWSGPTFVNFLTVIDLENCFSTQSYVYKPLPTIYNVNATYWHNALQFAYFGKLNVSIAHYKLQKQVEVFHTEIEQLKLSRIIKQQQKCLHTYNQYFSLAGNENKCCADYSLWMNNRFYCEYFAYLFKISVCRLISRLVILLCIFFFLGFWLIFWSWYWHEGGWKSQWPIQKKQYD